MAYHQYQPYGGQNPEGQSGYGQQASNGGYQPQGGYSSYNPSQGGPQYGYPSGGYYYPRQPQEPYANERLAEKKQIKTRSIVHGLSLLGFSILGVFLSILLRDTIPNFRFLYKNNPIFQTAIECLFSIVVIFVPFFCAYFYLKHKQMLRAMPLGMPKQPTGAVLLVFVGLAACMAGSYASGLFNTLLENLFHLEFILPQDDLRLNSVPLAVFTVLKVAVIPALVEEFAIRGVVMQSLRRYGDGFAILMSAMVFALMHGNMVQIPFAFIAGIAIGYAVIVTDSMWTGIAIHFLNNLVAVSLQIVEDNANIDVQNLVAGIVLLCIFTVGIVCAVLYFTKFNQKKLSKGKSYLRSGERAKTYVLTVPMILAIIYLLFETAQYVKFR